MHSVLTLFNTVAETVSSANALLACLKKRNRHEPRVQRWLDAIAGHGLSPLDALAVLGIHDVPISATESEKIAELITHEVLEQTASLLNLRSDWLHGRSNSIYDCMLLDRSYSPTVERFLEWASGNYYSTLLAFKSGKSELQNDPHQAGALVLRREVTHLGNLPVYAYQPIFSLQDWGNNKQYWLALRAIWTARELGIGVEGYTAAEDVCREIAHGTTFIGNVLSKNAGPTWHPDDYVVRPSASSKGDPEVEGIPAECDRQLTELAGEKRRKR